MAGSLHSPLGAAPQPRNGRVVGTLRWNVLDPLLHLTAVAPSPWHGISTEFGNLRNRRSAPSMYINDSLLGAYEFGSQRQTPKLG